MAGQQDVPLFAAQPVANPRRRVVRLQIARGGQFGERVAGTPEHVRCLPCAQLAAVPHDGRLGGPSRGIGGHSLHRLAPVHRERAARIDIGPGGVAVMNEKKVHRELAAFGGMLVAAMRQVNEGHRGAGGWLLLLSLLLRIWEPLNIALSAPAALNALPIRGAPLALTLLLRLAVAAFAVAAGLALAGQHRGAVALAKASLAVSAATAVFVYTTPYFPNDRVPGDTPFYIAGSLAYYGGWFAYLTLSRRVRDTCV